MKYTEEQIEILAKSMYKAVKKALGTAISEDKKKQSRSKDTKDAMSDLMDPNSIAEAGSKTPPRRTSQMNKSSGLHKLKKFKKNIDHKRKNK